MKKHGAAIIGCGLISKNHFKALRNIENAEVLTACDFKQERAEEAQKTYGIPRIETDYRKVLEDPEIDVVHICLPHDLHAEVSIAALRAGKAVLSEKPMAITTADAERIRSAVQETGGIYGVCFQNRYNESSRYMREIVDSGKLGKLQGGRGAVVWNRKEEYYRNSDWRGTLSHEGGSALINQAIHTLDLLQWLTVPVKKVEASISTKRLKGVIETEDSVDVLMQGAQDERLLFYASNCYVMNSPVELEIVGENGSLHMVGNIVTTNVSGVSETRDFTSGTVLGKDYWGSGHGDLIRDFYEKLDTGERFPIGFEEAMTSVKLVEAIYTSGREDRVVEM